MAAPPFRGATNTGEGDMRDHTRLLAMAGAALLALAATTPAQAVEVQMGATTACKSALPAFDGNMRTRPLAMQNEGTVNAFVSCAHANVANNFDNEIDVAAVFLANNTTAPVSISCTLITDRLGAPNTYIPKTVTLGANARTNLIWTGQDDNNGDPLSNFVNFSCSLPPGTGISRITFVYPGSL